MSAEIRSAVETLLRDAHVEFVVELRQRGHMKPSPIKGAKAWECDAWDCDFRQHGKETMNVPFFTGTGHRKYPGGWPHEDKTIRRGTLAWEEQEKRKRPVAPCAADVLYSLVMDDTRGESFESWAADFGMDSDSRSALAVYLQCQESTSRALRFFGGALWDSIQTAVEGY